MEVCLLVEGIEENDLVPQELEGAPWPWPAELSDHEVAGFAHAIAHLLELRILAVRLQVLSVVLKETLHGTDAIDPPTQSSLT